MKQMRNVSGRHQRGAVAIMVGLTIFVLIAFLGLTVDLGRLFITKTELSNAADACALAAAAELNGEVDALNRAESAGITVGQRNNVGFQGSAVTILPNSDIKFSEHLNVPDDAWRTKAEVTNPNDIARMKYAKCTLPQKGILPFFMQVVGFGPQDVVSHAVATLAPGITNCGLPIAICKQPAGTCTDPITKAVTPRDAMGLCKNEWVCSKFTTGGDSEDCSGSGMTGSFNWIDYTPSGGGANELADIITGAGQCELETGKEVGKPGGMTSLGKAWNTRFGLYTGGYDINEAPPDFSGFAYTAPPLATPGSWPSKYNAYKNLIAARLTYEPYQGDVASGLDIMKGESYKNSTSKDLHDSGSDRRLAVVPVIDCKEWEDTNHKAHILKFACIVMLHPMRDPGDPLYLEHQGLSDAPGNPCSTIGLPGGPGGVGPKVPTLVR